MYLMSRGAVSGSSGLMSLYSRRKHQRECLSQFGWIKKMCFVFICSISNPRVSISSFHIDFHSSLEQISSFLRLKPFTKPMYRSLAFIPHWLQKYRNHELVSAIELNSVTVAFVAIDALFEFVFVNERHNLREDCFSFVHGLRMASCCRPQSSEVLIEKYSEPCKLLKLNS